MRISRIAWIDYVLLRHARCALYLYGLLLFHISMYHFFGLSMYLQLHHLRTCSAYMLFRFGAVGMLGNGDAMLRNFQPNISHGVLNTGC